MSHFQYKILDADGKVRNGLIDLPFDNPLSAMTYLERQGGTVLYAKPLPPWLGSLMAMLTRFFDKSVKREEMAEALNNLGVMLRAGMPLLASLHESLSRHDNPTLARMGKDLTFRIQLGVSLSEAARIYQGRFFSDTTIFLMRLGEASGKLDSTILDAAESEKRMDRIIRDTRGAMVYPLLMFVAMICAFIFWMIFVVPMITDLLGSMNVELPALTQFVINLSHKVSGNLGTFLVLFVAGILGLGVMIRQSPRIRYQFHWLLLYLPVAKVLITASSLAFITEYFSLLIRSGVDTAGSLRIISESVANEVYRAKLRKVIDGLIQGHDLHDAFNAAQLFPGFVVRMIGVGEKSGTLPAQLEYLAEIYRTRLGKTVANIGKSIEPIALALGGGMMVLMMLALLVPIYSVISKLGGAR